MALLDVDPDLVEPMYDAIGSTTAAWSIQRLLPRSARRATGC